MKKLNLLLMILVPLMVVLSSCHRIDHEPQYSDFEFRLGEVVTFAPDSFYGDCYKGVITDYEKYWATWESPQVLRIKYKVAYCCKIDDKIDITGTVLIEQEQLRKINDNDTN